MSHAEKAETGSARPATKAPDGESWKARYEEERLRLAKLWVAYRDVERELEALKAAAKTEKPIPAPAPRAH